MLADNQSTQSERIRAILTDVIRRRQAGDLLPDLAILAAHPDLADQLETELARLQPLEATVELSPNACSAPQATQFLGNAERLALADGASGPIATGPGELGPLRIETDRFRKVRPLAAGGIGEVWIAQDLQLRREVALKELQDKHRDERVKRERFVMEGQVTGVLEHPGIVPVYALGADAQKHAFYAMRLIRGESMTRTIRALHDSKTDPLRFSRNHADFRGLLRRFADVCVTIAYAHSRGILHRDLKPDNVMLGKYGETYVVDWGMARIVGARAEDYSLVTEDIVRPAEQTGGTATRYGSSMGTPGFMSPEQAAGRIDELGPATDIYSLGAVLYYILANKTPFEFRRVSEFLRKVAAGEIVPLQSINPAAPKELEAICMKAMSAAPENRYKSARDLAADVEQWLADEPISALPETAIDRVGRYVRRHYRWLAPVGLAAVIVAVTAMVSAALINQARHRAEASALAEEEAKLRAQANFLKARETVDTWLSGYSEALQNIPVAGVQAVRARMLELAAKEYEEFARQPNADPSVQLEQGLTLARLASIFRALGRQDEAAAKTAAAAEILAKLGTDPSLGRKAASSLAMVRGLQALSVADIGKIDEADKLLSESIHELEIQARLNPTDPEVLKILATLWTNRGGILAKADRSADADRAFQQAMTVGDSLASLSPADLEARLPAAAAQLGAGQSKLLQGDGAAASRIFEKAAGFFGAAANVDEENVNYLQLVVTANGHLAAARRRLGDAQGEQAAYMSAIEAAKRLFRLQPEIPSFRVDLAMMQTDLGQSLAEQFEPAKAELVLQEAVGTLSASAAEYPAVPAYREALATALANLAQVEQSLGHTSEAVLSIEKASAEIAALTNAFPVEPHYRERLAVCDSIAAQALFLAGRKEEAQTRFAASEKTFDAMNRSEATSADRRHAEAIMLSRYGEVLHFDDPASADPLLEKAAQKWAELLDLSTDPQFAVGAAWFHAMRPDQDHRDAKRAVALLDGPLRTAPTNFRYRLTLAVAEAMAGDWENCLKTIDAEAAKGSSAAPVFGFPRALALEGAGKSEEARECWQEASNWTAQDLPGEWEVRSLERATAEQLKTPALKKPAK